MEDNIKENRTSLNDDTENIHREGSDDMPREKQPAKGQEGEPWYTKPELMGNTVGDRLKEVLSPVGQHVGPVFSHSARPVGGVVEPTVGGVMKMGKGWGEQLGVGFGNHEGGPANQMEAEGEKMKEQIGGKEQTADNPLGL
ncbi:uncharacterized protein Z518_07221 [Rhinocladiella mackenziei CBS 650.93]|uniref:Uncharacterized protein n=1 Tax=Rhinocladiella mackenziei CBS 650.93 TaxID=1442369 RepID=A0A0D2GZP9_9EURO|nr:uncharacterized protein Z518_07221 [Rhinocladiella mackenziei CBS 650.93]KIX03668.1 hypothetical protein Z518_07221 [Rhinocladiella mackenziei CBS 650.93]